MIRGLAQFNQRFAEMVIDAQENLDIDRPLILVPRIPSVNAPDEEIRGRFYGTVVAADLIGMDQEATTYTAGAFETQKSGIAKMKIGFHFTEWLQAQFNRLARTPGGIPSGDTGLFGDSLRTVAGNLVRGLRMRQEQLLFSMLLDGLSYDRGGLKLSGSWGMPADLKFTPSVDITLANAATAKPITEIRAAVKYARDTYGEVFDTLIMPSADRDDLLFNEEVQAAYKGTLLGLPLGTEAAAGSITVSPYDDRFSAALARLLGVSQIILSDGQMQVQGNTGAMTRSRYQPLGTWILCNGADLSSGGPWDWANGEVIEAQTGAITGVISNVSGSAFGPFGYTAPSNLSLNPPNFTAWGVMRGFPRKHRATANAIINAY